MAPNKSGTEGRDSQAPAAELRAKRFAETDEAELAHLVRGVLVSSHQPQDARHIEHMSLGSGQEHREQLARELDRCEEVYRQESFPLRGAHVEHRATISNPRIVHQNIQMPPGAE